LTAEAISARISRISAMSVGDACRASGDSIGASATRGKRTLIICNPGEPPFHVEKRKHIRVSGWNDGGDLNAVFTAIYLDNRWGSDETRSGDGSERSKMKQVAAELGELIRDLGITSLLDAPCGDFNWMRDVDLAGVSYLGCDVVPDLIEANEANEANADQDGEPERSFMELDFTVGPVPYAHLILCRDALVHLPYQHIIAALNHFQDSGSKYLLTTTFPETRENEDICTGWWRPVNLQLPPFSLPAPIRTLSDKESENHYPDKVLALWDLQALTRVAS
jgi:hypothetical protein